MQKQGNVSFSHSCIFNDISGPCIRVGSTGRLKVHVRELIHRTAVTVIWHGPTVFQGFQIVLMTCSYSDSILAVVGHRACMFLYSEITKYGNFIPVHSSDTAPDTAKVLYQHIITQYVIPWEIVSDRDRVWSG